MFGFLLQSTAAMAGITCYKAKSVITLYFCYDTVLNLQLTTLQLSFLPMPSTTESQCPRSFFEVVFLLFSTNIFVGFVLKLEH